MYRLFLASRYLLARPINLLGVLGVTVGVWALIVVVSIFSGFLKVVSEHLRSAGADLSVVGIPESMDTGTLRETALRDPNVAACAGRLVHYGLLLRPGERPGPLPLLGRGSLQGGEGPFLYVLGIDPAEETGVTDLARWLTEGVEPELRVRDLERPLQPIGGRPAILLGRSRMQKDGLRPGDAVVLTTGNPGGPLDSGTAPVTLRAEFAVAGAFRTRHVGFDGNNTFVHVDVLRSLLLPDRPLALHELSLRARDGSDRALHETAERLRAELPRALGGTRLGGVPVLTWRERNRGLLLSVEHQRSLMKIVLVVTMAVAAFLMFATLSMMVAEKTADIGILAALGGTPLGVTQVFLTCGLSITVLGLLLGVVLGCLSAVYLDSVNNLLRAWFDVDLFPTKVYNLDRVPYDLDPAWIAQVCGLALLVGALVTAVPALRAARHDPLVSLRGA